VAEVEKRKRIRLNAELRREQILDEAMHLIGQCGYYGFSIQELAQRCGLTNAGLLYYFDSKDKLLIALLQDHDRREAAAVTSAVGLAQRDSGLGKATPKEVLDRFHAIVVRNAAQPEIVRLFTVLRAEALNKAHPAYDYFLARDKLVIESFAKGVAPYVKHARSTARQLLAVMCGLEEQWLRAGLTFNLVAEWDYAATMLLPQLGGARGRRKASAPRPSHPG
jgi:AcrR family transcriptional regulator